MSWRSGSRFSPPSHREIKEVAETTSTVLRRLGYRSCVVGGLACTLWGMQNRTPNDVDIVVLDQDVDIEALKRSLVKTDSLFYLVTPKTLFAHYMVLWYMIPGSLNKCKVDLLKPGELDIPSIPRDKLYGAKDYKNMRIMPFLPVLLLKVQAWWHHSTSSKLHYRRKVLQDVRDINELLDIAVRRGYKLKDLQSWLPEWFQDVGRGHVGKFKKEYPSSINSWALVMA